MTFNVREMSSQIARFGIAQPSRYEVEVEGAPSDLNLMCESAELPGKSFATTPYQTFGPVKKLPYGALFDDLNLTFICSDDMYERIFFDEWQNLIQNPKSHYFGYFKDYAKMITVRKYNLIGELVYTIQVLDAYPMTIITQPVSYGAHDTYQTVTVNFAYHKWIDPRAIPNAPGGGGSGVPETEQRRGHNPPPTLPGGLPSAPTDGTGENSPINE